MVHVVTLFWVLVATGMCFRETASWVAWQKPATLARRCASSTRVASSRMPSFSPEEQAELDRIMSGDYWDDSAVDFSGNLPKQKGKAPPPPPPPPPPPKAASRPPPPATKKVAAPNSDWRAAASKPAAELRAAAAAAAQRRPSSPGKPVDIDILDLDYDDFEAAMMEEDGGGFGQQGSKSTYAPTGHDGLMAGDAVPAAVWEGLVDPEGNAYKFTRLHKDQADVVVLYADPRRMTDEFKVVLSQFNKLPLSTLKVAAAAINCDDVNDHRKYVKKNTLTCALLADPSKRFMDAVKARIPGRLAAALLMLDVKSNKVLKVWYENDWDAFSTKDLLVEEVKAYRANPVAYVQMQIGIR